METLKVIKHIGCDDRCLANLVNYPIVKDQILKAGFGIDINNSENALLQFKKTAAFFNNEEKTPAYHYIVSFTHETAPTPEKAMELTKKIFKPITENYLTAIGVHEKEREGGKYHTHNLVCTTNFRNGSMLYCDNRTNYRIAQRVADVTGEPTRLIVRWDEPDSHPKEWECRKIFIPLSAEK